MKVPVIVCLFLLPVCAQEAGQSAKLAVPPPPDTVVAKIAGKSYTAAEVRRMLGTLPKDAQDALMQNPKDALQSFMLMQYLEKEANKTNLAVQSPFKEQLAFQKTQVLAQAAVSRWQEQVKVTPEEQKERYHKDKGNFELARIRVIFVSMADPKAAVKNEPGKEPPKRLNEGEARDKAQSLLNQLRAGADFAELAKAHSDDAASNSKGGEYGFVRPTQQIPEGLKNVIFTLKAGEMSDLVKQPSGFFIIKVDETKSMTFEEAQPELEATLKQEKFKTWMSGLQKQFEVSIENQDFFNSAKGPAGVSASATAATK